MANIIHLLFALIALGFLVFIHELGHYFVAKHVGMRVEVFSIGFGKPLFSWVRKGVRWQFCLLFLGGYVKIAGMEPDPKTGKMPKDGFFGKSPLDRIKVAVAGPLANLVLAFFIFTLMWAFGGRIESYATLSNRIGYVDPRSEITQYSVKAGDRIESINNDPYEGFKDVIYAGLLSDEKVKIKGSHISYSDGGSKPFTVEVYPSSDIPGGMNTIGILAPSRFLIYDPNSTGPLPEGSPMAASGIEPGDRLLWADGEPLYSLDQLADIVNQQKALLTVQRGARVFLVRVPRMPLSSLRMNSQDHEEILDRQFAAHIRTKQLFTIPYNVSHNLIVESPIPLIGEDRVPSQLHPGDKILAVDGHAISFGKDLLSALQTHKIQIVVQRGITWPQDLLWTDSNAYFDKMMPWTELEETLSGKKTTLVMLKPVTALKYSEFLISEDLKKSYEDQIATRRLEIEAKTDSEERRLLLQMLSDEENKLRLGIPLTDLKVRYNPLPHTLFVSVFKETTETLKSLVTGYIHPKMLSGPVGIIQVMKNSWSSGVFQAFFWVGAISINLGVLNLLPLPVLDGGYIILSLYEMITKKRVNPKVLERIVFPFILLLIGFFLFVTYYDIKRLF